MENRYCKKCGAKLKEGSCHCGNCGTFIGQLQTADKKKNINIMSKKSKTLIILLCFFTISTFIALLMGKKTDEQESMPISEEKEIVEECEYIAVVKEQEDWFIINEKNKKLAKIPIQNIQDVILQDNIQFNLIEILTSDGKVAFVDTDGNVVLEPIYEWAEYSSELTDTVYYFRDFQGKGFCKIKLDGKYGIIDTEGKVILKPLYDEVFPIGSNMLGIKLNDKYGLSDCKGNLVRDFIYDEIGINDYCTNSFIKIKKDTKVGFINIQENIVVEPVYDNVRLGKEIVEVNIGEKYGLTDSKGNMLSDIIYDTIYLFESEDGLIRVLLNGKYGFINSEGEIVIEPIYEYASDFSMGIAVVKVEDKGFGYIDTNGDIIIDPVYDSANKFSKNGLALVNISGESIFINKNEEAVLMVPYEFVTNFGINGLAAFYQNGKYGCINEKGEVIIEPIYDNVNVQIEWQYQDGTQVEGHEVLLEKEGKYGYADATGRVIVEPLCDMKPWPLQGEELYLIVSNGKNGLINKEGKVILKPLYDSIFLGEELGTMIQNDKAGYFSYDGNIVVEAIMDMNGQYSIYREAPYVWIEKEGKYGYVNGEGEIIIEPQYDWVTSFVRKR